MAKEFDLVPMLPALRKKDDPLTPQELADKSGMIIMDEPSDGPLEVYKPAVPSLIVYSNPIGPPIKVVGARFAFTDILAEKIENPIHCKPLKGDLIQLPHAEDLPKPTQASLPKRAQKKNGKPPKFVSVRDRLLMGLNKTGSERAEEIAQIAEFEARGKVYRCKMGETAYAQDENGIYINPIIRRKYQSGLGRAKRASRMSTLTRTLNAQK